MKIESLEVTNTRKVSLPVADSNVGQLRGDYSSHNFTLEIDTLLVSTVSVSTFESF